MKYVYLVRNNEGEYLTGRATTGSRGKGRVYKRQSDATNSLRRQFSLLHRAFYGWHVVKCQVGSEERV